MPIWIQFGPAGLLVVSGVGKTTGSVWAAATSAGLRATSRERAGRGVGDVPLQVPEAVVRRVEDAEAVGLRVDRGRRVGRAVDDRRVVERLHAHRDVRRAGISAGSQNGCDVRVAGRVVVRVGDRRRTWRPWRAARTTGRTSSGRTRSCPTGRPGSAPACRRAAPRGCPRRPSGPVFQVGSTAAAIWLVAGHEGLVLDDERGADARGPRGRRPAPISAAPSRR